MKVNIDLTELHVKMVQFGPDNFHVQYGRQIKRRLTYVEAATELGECIMHSLACNGQLDNRTKAEEAADKRGVIIT